MTTRSYYRIGTLADYFYPSSISGVSDRVALERLQRQIHTGKLICDPPLPTTPYRFRLLTGRLVIETSDALFDAADFQALTLVEEPFKPYRLPAETAAALGINQEPEEPAPHDDNKPPPTSTPIPVPEPPPVVDTDPLPAQKPRRGPKPLYAWKTLVEPYFKAGQFAELSDARDAVLSRFDKVVPHPRYVEKWILANHPEWIAGRAA